MVLGIEYAFKGFEDDVSLMEEKFDQREFKGLGRIMNSSYGLLESELTDRERSKISWAFDKLRGNYLSFYRRSAPFKEQDVAELHEDFDTYVNVVRKLIEELRDIDDRNERREEFN